MSENETKPPNGENTPYLFYNCNVTINNGEINNLNDADLAEQLPCDCPACRAYASQDSARSGQPPLYQVNYPHTVQTAVLMDMALTKERADWSTKDTVDLLADAAVGVAKLEELLTVKKDYRPQELQDEAIRAINSIMQLLDIKSCLGVNG